MPRLTHDQRIRAAALSEAGKSSRDIAVCLNVTHATVDKLIKRLQQTGTVDDRKRPGKSKISTENQDVALVNMSLQNRKLVPRELQARWQETGVQASQSTIKRRLRAVGLYRRVSRRKPVLSNAHKNVRFQWALQHRNWDINTMEKNLVY